MDVTAKLPLEHLSASLDLVGQPSVLSAAGVCRRWRRVATAHADFYRFVSLERASTGPYDMRWQPPKLGEYFEALLGDADSPDAPRLSINIYFERPNGGRGGSFAFTPQGLRPIRGGADMAEEVLREGVLRAIKKQLGRIVKLDISVSTCYFPLLLDVLDARANMPLLRHLALGAIKLEDDGPEVVPPVDVACITAPLLSSVSLFGIPSFRPSRALSNVRTLNLSLDGRLPQLLSVPDVFPSVDDMTLTVSSKMSGEDFKLSFSLKSLNLRSLALRHCSKDQWIPQLADQISFEHIPRLSVVLLKSGSDVAPVFSGLQGPLSMDIQHDGKQKIVVHSASSGLTRTIRAHDWTHRPEEVLAAPYKQLGRLSCHISRITVEHRYLDTLFRLGTTEFDTLQTLRVDFRAQDKSDGKRTATSASEADVPLSFWPPPTTSPGSGGARIQCPSLSTLELRVATRGGEAKLSADAIFAFASHIGVADSTTTLLLSGVTVVPSISPDSSMFASVGSEVCRPSERMRRI